MDDMQAIEQRIAGEMLRRAGPSEPVDDLAIFESVTAASRSHRWGSTMISALRFIAAAVIVALFGGFLLAGVLTTQRGDEMAPAAVTESPSPMTTEAFLSTMVTEEIEPGVLRVVDDGAGHAFPLMGVDHPRNLDGLHVGPDGAVWIWSSPNASDNELDDLPDQMLFRLGTPGIHVASPDGYPGWPNLASGLDGTLWAGGYSTVAAWDGQAWTTHDPRPGDEHGGPDPGVSVHVQPDGTVWAEWHDGFGRLGPDSWQVWDARDGMLLNNGGLWVLPDGEVYAAGGQYHGSGHQLLRFDGDAWRDVPLPDTRGVTRVTSMRLAPDGSVWALLVSRRFPEEAPQDFEDWWYEERPDEHLARLDGESWTMLHSTDAGVPTIIPRYPSPEPMWEIHPDGTIWALADPDPSDRDQRLSLWSFDGGTWQLRLDEADWLDIGPDGTVWVARSSGEDILSFDGSVWRRYPGLPALALWPGSPDGFDTAPDGTAWVLSGDEDALYVITPEAVAGNK